MRSNVGQKNRKNTHMPIFVWIAIAIAILLIGGGAATSMVTQPVAEVVNGPIGYAIAIGIVAVVAIVVWNKTRNSKNTDKEDP
jgi:purine-cytosine permease-like protein